MTHFSSKGQVFPRSTEGSFLIIQDVADRYRKSRVEILQGSSFTAYISAGSVFTDAEGHIRGQRKTHLTPLLKFRVMTQSLRLPLRGICE